MKKRTIIVASLLFVAASSAVPISSAFAFEKGSTDGVVGVLLKKYTLTETTFDKSQVTHDGAQLSLKQAGVYTTPAKSLLSIDNKVMEGKVQKQNFFVSASCAKSHCHVLQSGEKVYVTKIESKNDDLKFNILSVEDIDGGEGAERYGATVTFKLKHGIISEGSPDDIEQIVETVLGPADDSGGDGKQDSASNNTPAPAQAPPAPVRRAAAPPPPPPPAAPAAPPPALSIGETSSQVLQAYGMPTKIVDLGKKKTYFYKDIKVIFTDDKISDMQPL